MTVTSTTFTQPINNGANSAAIKAWGSVVSGLFSGAGLVQTTDTGQVNWTTVTPTYPSTISDTSIGYEVWKFNDSLQATKPIFLRVEYRISYHTTGPVSTAYIRITPCTQTNGAGTAAGSFTTVVAVTNGNGESVAGFAGTQAAFSAGDGSFLALVLANLNITDQGGGVFYIDRTRDSSGAITGEGMVYGCIGSNSSSSDAAYATGNSSPDGAVANTGYCQVASFTTLALTNYGSAVNITPTTGTGCVFPGQVWTSLSAGTTVGFSAPDVVANQKVLPPILAAIAYWGADVAPGSTITLTISGSTHTYYTLGTGFSNASRRQGQTAVSLAVRYE